MTRIRLVAGIYTLVDSVIQGGDNFQNGQPLAETTVTTQRYSHAKVKPYLARDFVPTGAILHAGDSIYFRAESRYNGKPVHAFSKRLGLLISDQNTFMSSHGNGGYGYLSLTSYDGDTTQVQEYKALLRDLLYSVAPPGPDE